MPYGIETTVSNSAGAVTEVFRTPHFQEHKVSGMLLPTPLQLHLNLGMPLQNYMTSLFFFLRYLEKLLLISLFALLLGMTQGMKGFCRTAFCIKLTICRKCASLPFLGSLLKIELTIVTKIALKT